MTKIDMLNAQRAEKFTALCALVARDLGYGELPQLSEVDRDRIEGEAKHYVELWEETVEIKTSPTIRPITPLRRLLAEYHDTCERILDEQEIAVGLWAYKKRTQGRRLRSASFVRMCGSLATVEDTPGCYLVGLACRTGCYTPDLAPYCVPRFPGLLFVSASGGAFVRRGTRAWGRVDGTYSLVPRAVAPPSGTRCVCSSRRPITSVIRSKQFSVRHPSELAD